MIQIGGHFSPCKNSLKSSGVGGHDVRRIDDSTRGAIKSL